MKMIWYVFPPYAQDLGLIAPMFATEREAKAKRDEWNQELDGHYVIGVDNSCPII